ncbi:MAG: MarR family transcriptional regulator [Pseudomonadota bacterium]
MDHDDESLELAFQVDRFMRRLNARVHSQAPAFDAERVGPIGGMILLTLAEVQPAPMTQIVTMMGRDKAQLSRMFSNLEGRGLVSRSENRTDQRSSLLSLTAEGEDFVKTIKQVVASAIGELLEPLSAQERSMLLKLLVKT